VVIDVEVVMLREMFFTGIQEVVEIAGIVEMPERITILKTGDKGAFRNSGA
jgi:hypothetical protein